LSPRIKNRLVTQLGLILFRSDSTPLSDTIDAMMDMPLC
jgi:hypothetical protein